MRTVVSPPRRAPVGAVLLLLLVCGLIGGCASQQRAPADLDLARTVIVSHPSAPALTFDGPSGKGAAAGAGAVKGGGTGLTVGTLACLGTGPFFPLCVAAVVPTSMAIGAAGWATVSAIRAESADGMALQRAMLAHELEAVAYPARLAERLQAAARARWSVELPIASSDGPAWTIGLSLIELASDSHAEGQPYALRLEGRLRLRRAPQSEPVYEKRLEVGTEAALRTADWAANEGEALHRALGQAVQSLAEQLLADLKIGASVELRAAGP